ncbi:MG321/MPN456 family lipoprotein [Mycoplasmoides alvi]|uniref:MG321/MPN456 family lipoprotein n=1 Tax=Mycoplasmoides alvi TaxID=78580 RepID=UPI00051BF700|nr:MG321/MPN456 family lipoprotein [Mycoplasmoides alvi]
MNHKKKLITMVSSLIGIGVVSATLTVSVTSCSSTSNQDTFVYSNAAQFLDSQNGPLNAPFSNMPIDSYAASTIITLLTYETTGQFHFKPDGTHDQVTEDNLKFEAALKVDAYKEVSNNGQVVEELVGTLNRGDILTNANPTYKEVVANATKYVFTIDTKIPWIDSNGIVRDYLSSKDFERGLESYILGGKLGYQRNDYFVNLIGLDVNRTVGYDNAPTIDDPNYDIDNYRSIDDNKFTVYLNKPYIYILSVLCKSYFSPLPHNNEYVKNIRLTNSKTPIAWTGTPGNVVMDQTNTNFNQLYGSGPVGVFLDHTWFAGPYYFNAFTNSQILGILNEKYIERMKDSLDPNNGNKIKRYVLNYGSGNAEVFYNRFIANQESWVNVVPESKRTDAILNHSSEVYQTGISRIVQSNYIVYTPKPYVISSSDTITNNANVSEGAAKIIYNFSSKEGRIFKAGISGLINHFALSKLNLSSGDFQLSALPYGVFPFNDVSIISKLNNSKEYYSAISKNEIIGGLPRSYNDYVDHVDDNSIDENFLFEGPLAEFEIPYYEFQNNNYVKTNLVINKTNFINSLKAAGATLENPLIFQYKYGEASISSEYQNYLNSLKRAIEALGGGYITFNLIPRAGTTPSSSDWFNKQSSSMGYSSWSPDYDGVGSWLEGNSILTSDGAPSTNTYSSFPMVLKTIIVALKDLNVTYKSDQNKFEYVEPDNTKNSIFQNDPWANSKIWTDFNYSKKAVEFVNYMLAANVFDGDAINSMLNSPEQMIELEQRTVDNKYVAPTKVDQLVPWAKVFKKKNNSSTLTNADLYGNEMGIFAGLSDENALWLTSTSDRSFNFIPRSENGLNEAIINLLKKDTFKVRISGVAPLNLRDFQYLK